ncbi:MAG: 23S rRNA (adenine(2503)-C(2))-methyltransferase RlmN [Chthoniobacterales bacterium]
MTKEIDSILLKKPSVLQMSPEDWQAYFKEKKLPAYRANQVLDWVFKRRVDSFEKMNNTPKSLREQLAVDFDFYSPKLERLQGAKDTTQKYLFRLATGDLIETVLIPASPALYGGASDRRTLCVSSQVGCAYGCRFCASGLDGWKRNLSVSEIVSQFLQVEALSGEKINNIVFMGMGEPLANYENLLGAIDIINAPWGIGLGARHITISTSGLVPQIKKLAEEPKQIRLAISLHAATDEVRSKIMPVNRKYQVAELMDACAYFRARKKQLITFEYILIRDVNDSPEQARKLAALARRMQAKVNLIPYNKVVGLDWERPELARQEAFLKTLKLAQVSATLRREKGHDIAAACGQLRLQVEKTRAAI